ncbi:Matrixin family protein [Forsythia ovata]|uniref:Matrixin family protein n=1 Tax=Forsythia ovata TaxID=205694 RepID=A0ABD1QQ28_9LAMI
MTPIYTVNPKNFTTILKNHRYNWNEFEKFRDVTKGSFVDGISQLKKYFNHFGYLMAEDMDSTDIFDANLENAITRYQAKLGLPVTGKLDSGTLSEIMSPRCGVPDKPPEKLSDMQRLEYFTGRPRWARSIPMTLTYAFSPSNFITSLSMQDTREVFKRAFGHWAAVIPVTFLEANDYGFADIKIGFYSGDHGDGEAFDGVLGVLAHAFSPESGRFHLDAAETWAVDFKTEKSEVAVDLESVAIHEIGHLLGLAHTSVKEAVMYPSLKPRQKKLDLKIDDIKGVQALYGSNPNFNFQAFSESDISSNDAVDFRIRSEICFIFLLVLILWL